MLDFKTLKLSYPEKDLGWVDGVYYPRKAKYEEVFDALIKDSYVIKEYRETEEKGYGTFFYFEGNVFRAFAPKEDFGNYEIAVKIKNESDKDSFFHIREKGIVKLDNVYIEAGKTLEVAFTACAMDDRMEIMVAPGSVKDVSESPCEGKISVLEIKAKKLENNHKRKKPAIYLVSDSTVMNYADRFYPQKGWGQVLYNFFKGADKCELKERTFELSGVSIVNVSMGGRSLKNFYEDGRYDEVLMDMHPGDYVLIQFAHNDANKMRPNRYLNIEDYVDYFDRYIIAVLRRGGIPVPVTPVSMRTCGEGETFPMSFPEYRDETIKEAEKFNLPLIDLGKLSNDYLNKIGSKESKDIFMWLDEGEFPDGAYAAGLADNAHLCEYGAKVFANMVAKALYENPSEYIDPIRNEIAFVDKIEKPIRNRKSDSDNDSVIKNFAVQEITIDSGRGNFLLSWADVKNAASYRVISCIKGSSEKEEQIVSAESKKQAPTLPFSAPPGALREYFVIATDASGKTLATSKTIEVNLR